jgi:hypothetical protein
MASRFHTWYRAAYDDAIQHEMGIGRLCKAPLIFSLLSEIESGPSLFTSPAAAAKAMAVATLAYSHPEQNVLGQRGAQVAEVGFAPDASGDDTIDFPGIEALGCTVPPIDSINKPMAEYLYECLVSSPETQKWVDRLKLDTEEVRDEVIDIASGKRAFGEECPKRWKYSMAGITTTSGRSHTLVPSRG